MTENTTGISWRIVPVLNHDGGGLETEWSVQPSGDPWAPNHQAEPVWGFESLEAAAKWMENHGLVPDLRIAERDRLDHMLGALNDASPLTPDDLAEVITNALDIAKLARFSVRFRQLFEKRVMSVDPITGLQEGPSPF